MEKLLKDPSSILSTISTLTNEELEIIISDEFKKILQHKRYFWYHLDVYFKLIEYILRRLDSSKNVIIYLQNDSIFHKNFISEEQFCLNFLEILFPLLLNKLCEFKDQLLYLEICRIFKKVILGKKSEELQNYLEYILKLTQKTEDKFTIPRAIFKIIGTTYNSFPESYSATKVILQSLVEGSKNFKLIYEFTVVLLEVLGFDLSHDFNVKKILKYSPSNIEISRSLNMISEILLVVKDSRVDLNCSITINFSQFIENILKSILNLKTPDKESYQILEYALEVHPLLAEKALNALLTYSMFADNSGCEISYTKFLLKIFEIHTKLRRTESLISKMLRILIPLSQEKADIEECYPFRGIDGSNQMEENRLDVHKLLPKEVLKHFAQSLFQMASWQYTNIFKTIIFHLGETVDTFVTSNDDIHNNFIELSCKLLVQVVKVEIIDENVSSDKVTEKFIALMSEVKNILHKVGGALLEREHNQTLVCVFLELSNSWVERMLQIICYIEQDAKNSEMNNPNYLFSFLSNEQWILLAQRIMNFGESDCKNLMFTLTIKKYFIMQKMLGNKMEENIQHEAIYQITANVENACEYIVLNKFIGDNLVQKLDPEVVTQICDQLLSLIDVKPNILRDVSSQMWQKSLCLVLLKKIAKMMKNKAGSLMKKLVSTIDDATDEEDEEYFRNLKIIFSEKFSIGSENNIADEDKIQLYSNCLMSLNISNLPAKLRALMFLLLISLHKCFWNQESQFKDTLEKWIIFFVLQARIDLTRLLDPSFLIEIVTTNFDKKEEILVAVSKVMLRNENGCKSFAAGIDYLLKISDNTENLQYTLLFLRDLRKIKKSEICSEYKEKILKLNFDIVTTKQVDASLIESYDCCLRHWMTLEEKDKLKKLNEKLEDYTNMILDMEEDCPPRGSTSLFSTVVPNKQIFKLSQELPSRLWVYCKTKKARPGEEQYFSKLICLIFEHVQNEKFDSMCADLLSMLVESIKEEDFKKLFKLLRLSVSLLMTSLNSVKYGILHNMLEDLMMEFCELKDTIGYNQEVFTEIMNFEVAVINRKPLTLSPGIITMLIMSPYTLWKKENDFFKSFNITINHMECLLKHRSAMVMDRISVYLKIFRCLLTSLCSKCGEAEKKGDLGELEDLTNCAHQLEKLVRLLVIYKRDVEGIACFLIADILHEYETHFIFPKVKVHLDNCFFILLSICDGHAVSYLLRSLTSASREFFEKLHSKYKKFHTFNGKV